VTVTDVRSFSTPRPKHYAFTPRGEVLFAEPMKRDFTVKE
jgi:hypothetical protein